MEKSIQGKISTFIYKILPGIIICLGVVLRLRQYLFNRALWTDEASLALNIVNRSFLGFFQTLDYDQVAPVAFLFIQKIAVQVLGNNEFALRLFPFLCGIAAMFVMYDMAKRYTANKAVSSIALGIFAVLPALIYLSTEAKQYSSDILVCLLAYMIGIELLQKKVTIYKGIFLGLLGAIAIWLSYTAVFVLAGVGLVNLFYLKRKEKKEIFFLFSIFAVWIISFGIYYFILLRAAHTNEYLLEAWKHGFMPVVSGESTGMLKWILRSFFDLFSRYLFASHIKIILTYFMAWFFLVGCVAMFRKKKESFFLLISPFFFILLAAALHKYPAKNRTLIFMLPMIMLFMAIGIHKVKSIIWDRSKLIFIILIIMFFYPLAIESYDSFKNPRQAEEIKPVIEYFVNNKRQGDLLYIYYASPEKAPAFRYYSEMYGISEDDYIMGVMSRGNWNNYVKDLNKLHGHKRVWILFSHVHSTSGVNEELFFLYRLDNMGTLLVSYRNVNASIYLYDLSGNNNKISVDK